MDLLLAWLLYPLALALVTGGLGLLVERGAGVRLPGTLVLPVGLAALIVVASLATAWSVVAPLATPLVVALALAGYAVGARRWRWSPALAAAAGVFAVFAAPVVLSGNATFAGYGVLGDTAIQFVGIDRLFEHGRSLADLPPSSYQAALQGYFDSGYPFGAQVAIGAVRPLVGQDIAWVYQPGLAFLVACLALCLYALGGQLVRGRWLRAGVAFVAAQPALVYAYALQGSVKELGTATVVALLAALTVPFARATAREPGALRPLLPLAVASAASLAVIGLAAAPWLGPILLAALVVSVRARPSGLQLARQVGAFALLTALLSLATLATLGGYFRVTTGVVTAGEEVGNLIGPLDPLQVVGIWINGDYRLDPGGSWLPVTRVLVVVALLAAALGLWWAVRRRAWAVLLYVGTALLACVVIAAAGSPWADAKAFMIVSPAVLFAAVLGPVALLERAPARPSWRLAGGLLALVLTGGVLVSNAFAYRDARLAPRERFEELQRIGEDRDGRGPLLVTEFEEFAKHFLRAADPYGVSEASSPRPADPAPPGGEGPRYGFPSDLDDLSQPYVHAYRTLVLRRSPVASRPPADYERVSHDRWYEVWERRDDGPEVLEHLPLGSPLSPAATPRCADVRALARRAAEAGAQLAFVERTAPPAFVPSGPGAQRPAAWGPDGREPLVLRTNGAGTVSGTLTVPTAGAYEVWLGGSFGTPLEVTIDDRRIGELGRALSGRAQYGPVGAVELDAGDHAVRITRGGRSLAPGAGNSQLGPLVLAPAADAPPAVEQLPPSRWRELCGRTLDWIEVVRG